MKRRLPFEILYDDRDVIVIDKPAGLLTTHTRAKEPNTAEEFLNDYVRKGQLRSRNHVWLVHRLDRETSGVMMFAKTEDVAETFRSNWNALTEKTYVARVEGALSEDRGVFESWLQEDADGYKVRSVPPPQPSKPSKPSKPPKLPKPPKPPKPPKLLYSNTHLSANHFGSTERIGAGVASSGVPNIQSRWRKSLTVTVTGAIVKSFVTAAHVKFHSSFSRARTQ